MSGGSRFATRSSRRFEGGIESNALAGGDRRQLGTSTGAAVAIAVGLSRSGASTRSTASSGPPW